MKNRKPFVLILACAFIALATLECLARLEDSIRYDADFIKPYTLESIFRGSMQTGKEGIPNARFRKWGLNELGYRGPPLRHGTESILFYGASETFGSTESDGKEYPQQVAELLYKRAPGKYRVVNAGIPGLRIGRVGYLDAALNSSKADHVFIYPSPANYIDTDDGFCDKATVSQESARGFFDNVRLFARSRDLVKSAIPLIALNGFHRFSIRMSERNTVPNQVVPQAWLNAFEKDLNCVVKRIIVHGAVPHLMTHATYFGSDGSVINSALLTSWRSFYPSLTESAFIELEQKANAIVRKAALDNGLTVIPIDIQLSGGPENFADFVHFTDLGANKVANIIVNAFLLK
jgi:hypothetical protein